MLLNDRVLVELHKSMRRERNGHRRGEEECAREEANNRRFAILTEEVKTKLTDQDDIFGPLVLIPQLTDVNIWIIRRLEHVLALSRGVALKARGRLFVFLQQRWA
jgi:hypothetical protein